MCAATGCSDEMQRKSFWITFAAFDPLVDFFSPLWWVARGDYSNRCGELVVGLSPRWALLGGNPAIGLLNRTPHVQFAKGVSRVVEHGFRLGLSKSQLNSIRSARQTEPILGWPPIRPGRL